MVKIVNIVSSLTYSTLTCRRDELLAGDMSLLYINRKLSLDDNTQRLERIFYSVILKLLMGY